MASLPTVLVWLTYLVLLVTTARTAYDAARQPNRQRVDVFLVVGSLAFILVLGRLSASSTRSTPVQALIAFLFLAQPYFLLRLVEHFWPVPRFVPRLALICTIAGALLMVAWPRRPLGLVLAIVVYFVVVQAYAAWAFTVQAVRTFGVISWRLRFAAVAAWIFAAIVLLAGAAAVVPAVRPLGSPIAQGLFVLMILCYYLGLAAPRFLRRSWQRAELYRYLRHTTRRSHDERARSASEDLAHAAIRSTGAAQAIVLRPHASSPAHLSVAADTDTRHLGVAVDKLGLMGLAYGGTPQWAPAEAFEAGGFRLRSRPGGRMLAVPISAGEGESTWGVLLVHQLYGSLFPADDLDVLRLLGAHAADVLASAEVVERRAEAQRLEHREAQQTLEHSRQRLVDIIEAAADFVTISQIVGPPTYLNAAIRQKLGLAPDETITSMFDLRPPSYQQFFEAVITPAIYEKGVWRGETQYVSRSGEVVHVSQVSVAHRNRNGEIEFLSTISRDITEEQKAAKRLEESENQLRQSQKMEAIGQLAGGVAHDFNNILTAILGYGELLADELAPAERQTTADELQKAARRAAALTAQLLAFGRRTVLAPRPTRLSQVVEKMIPMLRRLLGEEIEIACDTPGDDPVVIADVTQLEQIILNLAVNARDAMPGGGLLTLRTGSAVMRAADAARHEVVAGEYATLEVADTGCGMDDATRAHIFEPFFTTKGIGKGTGLGLSTVFGIVKQTRGTVTVASAPGAGTTFTIWFPGSDRVEMPEPAEAAAPVRAGGGETILVVEDEASILVLARAMLERSGYKVLTARDPAEAVRVVEGNPSAIDLLLTDMRMPGGTGFDLVAMLATTGRALPVLFMSGYSELEAMPKNPDGSHSQFLAKPFTAQELTSRVREVLDQTDRTPKTAQREKLSTSK